MALLAGSPAIDMGSNSNLLPSMTTDQRVFVARIVNGGISFTVDVGAYEFVPSKGGGKGNNGLGNGGDPAPPGLIKNGKGDFNDGYLSP
jgi:hypothetical protein